jgi:hypothetical protein
MEQEAMDAGRHFGENGDETIAAATEYWIPARAGMTSEYGDDAGGYGERVSHISSTML